MSYPSPDSYGGMQPSLGQGGDVDVEGFPLPPNLRSMSMSEPPIVDPDFGWLDQYPPSQFTDFAESSPSSGSASSGSVGQASYDWYDPLPPTPDTPVNVPYPADGARPHPAHPHNGSTAPQPAHGLAPIIPPQQRSIPSQPSNYSQAQQQQLPPYSQPQSRQLQPPFDQPPQYQHAASFPPPSYPPQHPPNDMQQQLAQTFNQHSRRASTPSTSPYPPYTGGTPGPYSGGRQSMYGPGDHSPVSHVSSASSLSSHSSSSSEGGLESGRHKRKQSSDSNPAEANGQEHSPTETTGIVKGRGRGAGKKQKAANNNNGNSRAKPNAKTAPVTAAAAAIAAKLKSAAPTATAPTAAAVADEAASVLSVNRSTDKADAMNVAWPMQSSTFSMMQQYFVGIILALKPDNQTITDVVHLIAHAMEVAPAKSFTMLLRWLGYVPQPAAADSSASTDDADCKRVVWRTPNPLLPYMTLPHHFRLNWSVSPETTMPEDTTVINFPQLTWWRAKETRFVRRPDGSVQAIETVFHPNPGCTPVVLPGAGAAQPLPTDSPFSTSGESSSTAATPTPQTPATPSTEPASPPSESAAASSPASSLPTLPPNEIDMSVLDLPCHVEVNSAFERMFGYSQSEIRILFIRHGKQALARLADAQQFRQCHELSMRDACEGQHEFSHVIDVRPKYGGTMKTIMHHKLVVGNEGLVWKKLYMWVPLTKSMKDAYIASKQQAAAANGAAATNVSGGDGCFVEMSTAKAEGLKADVSARLRDMATAR